MSRSPTTFTSATGLTVSSSGTAMLRIAAPQLWRWASSKKMLWQLFEYWRAIGQVFLTAQRKQVMRCATGLSSRLDRAVCPQGSRRATVLRQSATHLRQVGALSFGSPRSVRAVACHAAVSIPQSWLAPPQRGLSRNGG
jgi:hypothetical protein